MNEKRGPHTAAAALSVSTQQPSSQGAQDRRSQGRKGPSDLHLAAWAAGVGDAAAPELASHGEEAQPRIE
nr:unnamed protein product [Digitaria exilis]